MRPSSEAKRAVIIDAARALFVERGYDGASVQMIAQRAGAAVGSVTHLVGRKPAIGAEIYEALVADLVQAVRRSIGAGALASSASRIIEACLAWLEEDPTRLPLLDDLDQALAREDIGGHQVLGMRLAATLGQFGRPAAAQTGGLGGAELYALLLAPLLEERRSRGGADDRSRSRQRPWIDRLAAAAVAGLQGVAAPTTSRGRRAETGDLFAGEPRGG